MTMDAAPGVNERSWLPLTLTPMTQPWGAFTILFQCSAGDIRHPCDQQVQRRGDGTKPRFGVH